MGSRQFAAGILIAVSAVWLFGCAAKEVVPVHMVQPGDDDLDCMALIQQIAINDAAAADFLRKDRQVEQENTAKDIGGAIPGLGLLLVASIDLSNEEQIKARALIDRDERLRFLTKRKGCAP